MEFKLKDSRPIWQQLNEQLTERIVTGDYPPGSRFPSVRELASEAGVNPNTMQRALAQLETDGLVATNRTAGRTVTEDQKILNEMRRSLGSVRIDEYFQGMKVLGFSQGEAAALVWERREHEHE